MTAIALGKAASHCAHCAGSLHSEPSFAIYQTAAAVFAVLLLTGVVGEIRDVRTRLTGGNGDTPPPRGYLLWITIFLVVVMVGELIALLVLFESPSSPERWQQVAVAFCLIVSVPGISLLALAPLIERQFKEFAWVGRVFLALLLAVLLVVASYLFYTAVHGPIAHRYQVFGTCVAGACGLNERARPTIDSRRLGQLRDGDVVEIVCQVRGGKVTTAEGVTSKTWDKLANGHYVSDVNVDTPPLGSEIPLCPRAHAEH